MARIMHRFWTLVTAFAALVWCTGNVLAEQPVWTLGIDFGSGATASASPWVNTTSDPLQAEFYSSVAAGGYWGALNGEPFTGQILTLTAPVSLHPYLMSTTEGTTGVDSDNSNPNARPSDLDFEPSAGARWALQNAESDLSRLHYRLEGLNTDWTYNLWLFSSLDDEWVTFNDLLPDEWGHLYFGIQRAGGSVYLNAMVLQAIPEPSSLALLGIGGLIVMAQRRRSKTRP